MSSEDISQWTNQFNLKIKTRQLEQFGLLLCDLESCNNDQKQMLKKILFGSSSSHQCASTWCDYITLVIELFPTRKLQLQRLINKALELVVDSSSESNSSDVKSSRHYMQLHLIYSQLKSDDDALKYFHDCIVKKEIGFRFASMFLAWSELELRCGSSDVDAETRKSRALHALQLGLDKKAEPRHQLVARIQDINGPASTASAASLAQQKMNDNANSLSFDDGEVEFQVPLKSFSLPKTFLNFLLFFKSLL